MHEQLHGPQRLGAAGPRAQRRDAGVSRTASSAATSVRDSEAAFARKRAVAISAAVAASPTKRARMLQDAGVSWAPNEGVAAASACAERVAKRLSGEQLRFCESAAAAAKARAKRDDHVTRSRVQPARPRDKEPARPAGVILLRAATASIDDSRAVRRARALHFETTHDPVVFVRKAAASTARTNRGNAVLASPSEISDYAVCARIIAVVMGAYFAEAKDFLNKGRACGCQYKGKYRESQKTFRVAVSATVAQEFPTLPHVLKAIAMIPGGCFEYYAPENLCKLYKQKVKTHPRIGQTMCVLSTDVDKDAASKKTQPIFLNRGQFVKRFEESLPRAVCPGL